VEYKITVDIPTAGDTEIFIAGIGQVRNKSTVEVSTEQARRFKTLTGTTLGRANFQDGIVVETLTQAKKDSGTRSEGSTTEDKKGGGN
jgi:hypothetical protein